MDDDVFQLGGNIELSGFGSLDGGVMIVLKKIVGNYARKMSEQAEKFEKLSLNMKKVHEKEKSEMYELHAKMLVNGKPLAASNTDRNLFVAVDAALKGVMAQIK